MSNASMSKSEFIALIAMMFATIAFSIDAMLPALPEIAAQLSPQDANRAQLILAAFILGMGVGTFLTGPLSDALGRKPVILGGALLYIVGALISWQGETLNTVLLGRVLQGLGAAGPRVVAMAVIRDLYKGRDMARIVSIAMLIFTLVPAIAPLVGAGIIAVTGWRAIFLAFVLFAVIIIVWMSARLPETLDLPDRRPFRARLLGAALVEMFAHPTVRLSILTQTLSMGMLFSMITQVQPIYDVVFDQAEIFPLMFGGVALVSGSASVLNATFVVRVGMRRIVTWTLGAHVIISLIMLTLSAVPLPGMVYFAAFVVWQTTVFFAAGTTLGNLNAIAMEPMGHIAGMAASVIGAVATVGAAVMAAGLGQLFDGSLLPLALGLLAMSGLGYALMLRMGRVEGELPV